MAEHDHDHGHGAKGHSHSHVSLSAWGPPKGRLLPAFGVLLGAAFHVLVEAARRVRDPADVLGGAILVVASLGLLANLVAFALLRAGAKESLNVEGAYLEVLADTVGSVGVIVGAIVIELTG